MIGIAQFENDNIACVFLSAFVNILIFNRGIECIY